MIIYNASGHKLEIADLLVRNAQGNNYGLVMSTGASATVFDEDAEKSTALQSLIAAGTVTVTDITEPTTVQDSVVIASKGLKTVWTMISATPGTIRSIYGVMSTFTSMTSGTLSAVRGETNVVASCAVSGSSFLYGTQGKLVMAAGSSLDIGSGYACGLCGQIDITNGTMTGGHIAAVIASIQDTNNAHTNTQVNGVYVEVQPSVGGSGYVNSILQGVGSVVSCLDFAGVAATNVIALPATAGCIVTSFTGNSAFAPNSKGTFTMVGQLKILVGSDVRYIPFGTVA